MERGHTLQPLTDSYGRTIRYLRLSVTDRCNMACTYCVPPGGHHNTPRHDLLGDGELLHLSRLFTEMGVTKIRLTGGEPLLRRGVVDLCGQLKQLPGLKTLALSSNGLLLDQMAVPLAQVGVQAVNISLDTFDRERFRRITGGGDLHRVLRGLEAAVSAGLKVRVNAVAARWLTDDDLSSFVQLAADRSVEIRCIEYMPLNGGAFAHKSFLPARELADRFRQYTELIPCVTPDDNKAYYYALPGGRGRIGFIASITQSFCGTCDRVRLSASGKVRPCLFAPHEVDLLTPLRAGASDELLLATIRRAVKDKSPGHDVATGKLHLVRGEDHGSIRSIGG